MQRILSVDACRLLAILAVIAIHTLPFAPAQPALDGRFGEPGWAINQAARFAVPFFFVISGYFWAVKQRTSADPVAASWAMGRRIALIFAAWSLIYLIPFDLQAMARHGLLGPLKMLYWNLASWLSDPVRILSEGSKMHLWFLPALLSALAITACFARRGWYMALGVLAALLYIAGVLGKAYLLTPVGISLPFETRNGPFLSTLLFAGGAAMSRREAAPDWLFKGVALFVVGMALQIGEMYYLSRFHATSPYQDYTFGTCLLGIGFAMAALSNHPWLRSQGLGSIGVYTLGIYAVHMVFVDMLRGVRGLLVSTVWEVAYPLMVLALSVAAVLLMARSSILRRIVA